MKSRLIPLFGVVFVGMLQRGLCAAALAALLFMPPAVVGQAKAASGGELPVGASSYAMPEKNGATDAPLTVYCYRGKDWKPGRPIVLVFHGMKRNAAKYREGWMVFADNSGLLVVCPEFTQEKYPGPRYYNTGNIMDKTNGKGRLQPKSSWVFPVVDSVIRDVKKRMRAGASPVAVFGHSAGAQMVHRYILFGGTSEASLIMPSNAGWYTMPDKAVPFPYGLGGVPVTEKELVAAFAKPVVILLGEKDTQRAENLRQTAEADRQGQNRLERGKNFFAAAKAKAAEMGVPFNWREVTVPGVGHDGAAMAGAALAVIAQTL